MEVPCTWKIQNIVKGKLYRTFMTAVMLILEKILASNTQHIPQEKRNFKMNV